MQYIHVLRLYDIYTCDFYAQISGTYTEQGCSKPPEFREHCYSQEKPIDISLSHF